jgi:non-canonical poly(A) RNA polymerase PAPD5/7
MQKRTQPWPDDGLVKDFVPLPAAAAIRELLASHRANTAEPKPDADFGDDFIPFSVADSKQLAQTTRPAVETGGLIESPPKTPWLQSLYYINDYSLRLHEEIIDLAAFLSPRHEEEEARQELLTRVTALVHSLWPAASVQVFGSCATRLHLPVSDLDVVVLDVPGGASLSVERLKQLALAIRVAGWASYLEEIFTARVPILKFSDSKSGLSVDVCLEQPSGLATSEYTRQCLRAFPALRPLLLVLKVFLYARNLHQTYGGGVGSFLLTMMVAG